MKFAFGIRVTLSWRCVAIEFETKRYTPLAPPERDDPTGPDRLWTSLRASLRKKLLAEAEEVERFEQAWLRGIAPEPLGQPE